MSNELVYRIDRATVGEIEDHLSRVDEDFIPVLSGRVDISAYASKLVANAVRFEAWTSDGLVGLLALYCNDPASEVAYISNVSVLKEWMGRGVASALMLKCFEHVTYARMRRIRLEVSLDNEPALRFYIRNGFSLVAKEKANATLERCMIEEKERYER